MPARFVAVYQKQWSRRLVEHPFFAWENAAIFAEQMGGWVIDADGRILADFRPRWRQRLARWWTRMRIGWRRTWRRRKK